jgi:hypothetical protein
MTSESPDEERERPSLPSRRVTGPVFASVVLHSALLALIVRVDVPQPDANERQQRSTIRVSIALPLPPPVVPEAPVPPPELPAPEVATQPDPDVAETQEPVIAEQTASAAEDLEEALQATAEAAPRASTEAWTPARIRSAIALNAIEQRRSATEAWLTECLLEQKEHGRRECDEQLQEQDYSSDSMRAARNAGAGAFASVPRATNDWRMIQQFMRSNAMLEDMAEQGGVVAELATDRILINNEYMRYLQGNVLGFQAQDPMWQAMNSGFTADVLGGRQLALPGNVPFRCGTGKLRPGLTPGGVGVSDIVDCVFEFTGFTIDRPEQPGEQNVFRIVPVIPGSRQSATLEPPPANPVTP